MRCPTSVVGVVPPPESREQKSVARSQKISPLRIRGARGVTNKCSAAIITPFYPPYLKGDIQGGIPSASKRLEGANRTKSSCSFRTKVLIYTQSWRAI